MGGSVGSGTGQLGHQTRHRLGKRIFETGHDLKRGQIHVRVAPPDEELLKIPGVVSIDPLPNGLLRVRHAEGQMPAEALHYVTDEIRRFFDAG